MFIEPLLRREHRQKTKENQEVLRTTSFVHTQREALEKDMRGVCRRQKWLKMKQECIQIRKFK